MGLYVVDFNLIMLIGCFNKPESEKQILTFFWFSYQRKCGEYKRKIKFKLKKKTAWNIYKLFVLWKNCCKIVVISSLYIFTSKKDKVLNLKISQIDMLKLI